MVPSRCSALHSTVEWGTPPQVCSRSHRMAFVLDTGSDYVAVCLAWHSEVGLKLKKSACLCLLRTGIKSCVPPGTEGRHYGKPAWPLVCLKLKTLLVSGLLLLLRSQLVSFWTLHLPTQPGPSPQVMLRQPLKGPVKKGNASHSRPQRSSLECPRSWVSLNPTKGFLSLLFPKSCPLDPPIPTSARHENRM